MANKSNADLLFTDRLLYKSICDGDTEYLQKQIDNGLNVNHVLMDGKTMVDTAVQMRNVEIVNYLLNLKCNPNIINGRLLNPGEKETEDVNLEKSCMYLCLVRGDTDITKSLVRGGFDVNMRDTRQCSALWHAVDSGSKEMVEIILQSRGVNVNLPDMAKLRPLHVACLHGYWMITRLLLRHKAIVDATQMRGLTPLILACKSNCYRTVQCLLAHYANPNHQSSMGVSPLYTVLHNTQMKRDPRIIILLLAAGARVNANLLYVWRSSEKLTVFNEIQNLYDLLKYESETPKSLKSYCAKMIRKLMYVNRMFTMGYCDIEEQVVKLQIPKFLQEYILLKIV